MPSASNLALNQQASEMLARFAPENPLYCCVQASEAQVEALQAAAAAAQQQQQPLPQAAAVAPEVAPAEAAAAASSTDTSTAQLIRGLSVRNAQLLAQGRELQEERHQLQVRDQGLRRFRVR